MHWPNTVYLTYIYRILTKTLCLILLLRLIVLKCFKSVVANNSGAMQYYNSGAMQYYKSFHGPGAHFGQPIGLVVLCKTRVFDGSAEMCNRMALQVIHCVELLSTILALMFL